MEVKKMKKKIIIVAPHPDDETLGCGGTILKYNKTEFDIYWLIVTAMKENNGFSKAKIKNREKEILAVQSKYKFKKIFELGFPAANLDSIEMNLLIKSFYNIFNKVKPHTVYLNYAYDVHTDHEITFKAVHSAIKNFRCKSVEKILLYETLSETDFAPSNNINVFSPNYFVDITRTIKKKCSIAEIYKSEFGIPPFPRSIENIKHQAALRGSRISVRYAEAFQMIFQKG